MIWYEVVENLEGNTTAVRRFRTKAEAEAFVQENVEWVYDGYETVDTDGPYFYHQ